MIRYSCICKHAWITAKTITHTHTSSHTLWHTHILYRQSHMVIMIKNLTHQHFPMCFVDLANDHVPFCWWCSTASFLGLWPSIWFACEAVMRVSPFNSDATVLRLKMVDCYIQLGRKLLSPLRVWWSVGEEKRKMWRWSCLNLRSQKKSW